MYKVGSYVVHRRNVCKIISIKEKYYNDTDYYELVPNSDESLTMHVPVTSDKIRKLISKKEVEQIIDNIPNVEIIQTDNDKAIETEYKNLLNKEKPEDLIKIIKTTYLRNKDRLDNNKKIGDRDDNYFNLAEGLLYTEFSIVLNKTVDEVKEYVINRVEAK